MKVFKIATTDGEVWHVAAEHSLHASKYLLENHIENIKDIESVDEVPEEEWGDITVYFDERDEKTGEQIEIPLNELMKTQTETQIMCSTAWIAY